MLITRAIPTNGNGIVAQRKPVSTDEIAAKLPVWQGIQKAYVKFRRPWRSLEPPTSCNLMRHQRHITSWRWAWECWVRCSYTLIPLLSFLQHHCTNIATNLFMNTSDSGGNGGRTGGPKAGCIDYLFGLILTVRSIESCFNTGLIRGLFYPRCSAGEHFQFRKRRKGQLSYLTLINFYMPAAPDLRWFSMQNTIQVLWFYWFF